MIHTVKGFGVVKKTEMHVLLELSCFFDDPMDDLWFLAFSKSSLNIWKFVVEPWLGELFEHYFTSV